MGKIKETIPIVYEAESPICEFTKPTYIGLFEIIKNLGLKHVSEKSNFTSENQNVLGVEEHYSERQLHLFGA